MNIIIAGGRDFTNYQLLKLTMDEVLDKVHISEVVCGEATGADTLGKQWAIENNIPVKSFKANWDKHGAKAGPLRNREMGLYADYLVAFWDGKSRGTLHMIEFMRKIGNPFRIVRY